MKIVFMGTPDFSVPVLQKLIDHENIEVACVVTQPDRPKGRKQVLTAPPVKKIAQKYGIPVLQPEKVRKPEAVQQILACRPDVLITAAYGQILPQPLLDGPRLGCINVHASLLPAYRGAAPIQKAIIDGKQETGVTIMYMVKKLDAGDILAQVRVPITDDETFGTLHDKLSEAGSRLVMKTLPDLAKGILTPVKQDEAHVTFAPSIKRADESIDWRRSASDIRNLIRGLNPFPGAHTTINGENFKIFQALLSDQPSADRKPGTVLSVEQDSFSVATGSGGCLKVIECQPAGKKRMRVADYLHGRSLKDGTVLGEENEKNRRP